MHAHIEQWHLKSIFSITSIDGGITYGNISVADVFEPNLYRICIFRALIALIAHLAHNRGYEFIKKGTNNCRVVYSCHSGVDLDAANLRVNNSHSLCVCLSLEATHSSMQDLLQASRSAAMPSVQLQAPWENKATPVRHHTCNYPPKEVSLAFSPQLYSVKR